MNYPGKYGRGGTAIRLPGRHRPVCSWRFNAIPDSQSMQSFFSGLRIIYLTHQTNGFLLLITEHDYYHSALDELCLLVCGQYHPGVFIRDDHMRA